jgi:D-arginine dehydrogenase
VNHADIIVIGAGIAGASVAAHLAESRAVILVEREDRPGYHSTGRSAALFSEIYGNAVIRALTRASRGFFRDPPPGFAQHSLIQPRGSLFIATALQVEALQKMASLPDVAAATRPVSAAEAQTICPVLKDGYVAAALLEPECTDIDVHQLHQGYLRLFRARQGVSLNDSPVHELAFGPTGWRVRAGNETLSAPIVVNAAGAWADELGELAGLPRIGLQPRRRTALRVDFPAGMNAAGWPMVCDVDEQFYFKPDAGLLMLSPADETPSPPCDAQPDEWDIAMTVERVQSATTLQIDRLRHRWAGLRTFAPDRAPVVGFDARSDGFFWLAGQGGYGIQTAPALSRAAAAMVLGRALPDDLRQAGVGEAALSPSRFAAAPHSA